MNKYIDDEKYNGHRSRRKSKRQSRRRCRNLFLLIICCFITMIFAVRIVLNQVPPDTNKQLDMSAPHTTSYTEESKAIDEGSWSLLLVNKWNPIPDDYKVELTELGNGQLVDARIYPALQEMFDEARKDNIYPVVASGYRTTEKQQSLMEEKIAEYKANGFSAEEAKTKAEAWVAIPGTSEHQLGLGVDINADGIHSKGDEVYEWLGKNCYKYGFIRRYPADKTDITGIINEPWHYRYVGIKVATEIKNQNVCLEEYLNKAD